MTHDPGRPPFELQVDGFPRRHFRVHSFTGKEAMSASWSFDVVATAEHGGDLVEQKALAARATLLFHTGPEPRAFYGIVSSVRVVQAHHADHSIKYQVRVVPRLWLLRRKQRTRIFQKMRVPDIVTAVLLEAGITTRWQLTRAYPEREYVTQYEESDYKFVKRLLAEAGIFFYFFGGGPVDDAALTADAAVGAVASVGESVVGDLAGQDIGGLVGSAVSMAETLIPGDTMVCADDASCYPPVAGDDAAALAASTAVALAPAIGDALGAGDGLAGAAIGAASAVAGTVIADATEGGKPVPVLRFLKNEDAKVETYDKATRFLLRNTVRSSAAAFREFDPDRPAVRLQSKAVSSAPFPPSPFEQAAMAIAAAENVAGTVEALVPLPSAVEGVIDTVEDVVDKADSIANEIGAAFGARVPFEVYEHHDPFLFPKWAFGSDEAPKILRQKRRRASIATGESGCSDFSPGHRFELREHPVGQLDGVYVVTSVEHRGETHPAGDGERWKVYQDTFECAPSTMAYVPPRPKRKSVQVTLTATVVGPPGEEIHVDEKGQIKVQFHWDRDGKFDGDSSCWIRVMQPWSGAAWGHQFIPRVGTEVVVTFEGGDPDKPMVLGSVYNGTHPMPFKLPEQKRKSGIRTQTTPGGHGFNELSFDDEAGHELVFLHAQRDHEERVLRDQKVEVRGSRSTQVAHLHAEHVGGNKEVSIGGDRKRAIAGGDDLRVGKSVHVHVGGGLGAVVEQPAEVSLAAGLSLAIGGNYAVQVGGEHPADSVLHVAGSHAVGASERITLHAEEGLTLSCGKAAIILSPDKVVVRAPTVEIEAEQTLDCSSKKGPSVTLGDKTEILTKSFAMFTEGAALELGKDAKMKGASIQLGYDPSKPSREKKDADGKTKPLAVKLMSYFMTPYKDKKYHVLVDDQRIEGQTDGDGFVRCDVPATARAVQIRLWLGDYPQGPRREYTVDFDDEMKPATTVEGAKVRLKNLGYFHGRIDDVADDDFARAVGEFQQDHKDSHGLEVTGVADDDTLAAIADVHGS